MSQSIKRSQPLLSCLPMISNSDLRRCNGNIELSQLKQTNGRRNETDKESDREKSVRSNI